MKDLIKILLLYFLFLSYSFSVNTLQAQSGPVHIKGGWYFDVDEKQMVQNDGILVRGGRFYGINNKPSEANMGDYETIELSEDEYILPGIVDVHAHYRMDAFGSENGDEIDEFKYNALIYLANGVTSTFSNGVYYPYMELSAKRLSITEHSLLVQASYPVSPIFNTPLGLLTYPEEEGFYIGPSLDFSLTDNLQLSLIGQVFTLKAKEKRLNTYLGFVRVKGNF
jgi:hypothetical protein